jgi:ammonium transporter, Amt family
MNIKTIQLLILAALIMSPLVSAQTEAASVASVDTVWVLLAGALVFFMQPGFAMIEAGLTRAKNIGNILMKNIMDFCIGSLSFFIIGFAIMFGAQYIMLGGADAATTFGDTGIPLYAFWFFQAVFAATAATIVSGAMAERTKFISYLLFSFAITVFVYPLVGNWIWGGGWLSGMGFTDFAGSTVVHSVGGWAGLAGALVLGPRIGKYTKDKVSKMIPGHNISLVALGGFILWFGWFGFNAGSTISGTTADIGVIIVTTTLAGAAGALMAMITTWLKSGAADVSLTINGFLAGLVAITAGCAFVSPLSAILIGAMAGIIVVLAVEFLDTKLNIDDPVGAISVHGVCGAFGTIMVGIFAEPAFGGLSGLLFGSTIDLLLVQILGVITVFAFVFTTMFLFFKALDLSIGLRVSEHEERMGLDITEHAMMGYPDFDIPL